MGYKTLAALEAEIEKWHPPVIPEDIPHGDMPGDKVEIQQEHIQKANTLFPPLVRLAAKVTDPGGRVVIAICGGSGVGKSETASLLGHYFRDVGIGAYTLSGDNYPYRIPQYNDAERLRTFRTAGISGMLQSGVYSPQTAATLRALWEADQDADPAQTAAAPWLKAYQEAGRKGLAGYLGTHLEQNYGELNEILARFHAGANSIWLKRMGRTEENLWYEAVDMTGVSVLLIEWTHGNNDRLHGVDVPVLLNSTPAETRAHRRARNRDGKVDSPFTTMVLEIEQQELDACARKAKLILSKSGQLLSYGEYRTLMDAQEVQV